MPFDPKDVREPDAQFHAALGVELPSCRRLAQTIEADADRQMSGVAWWTTLEPEQRKLITHQLLLGIGTIPTHAARAELHLLEARAHLDAVRRRPFVEVLREPALQMRLIRRESAAEHLDSGFVELHLAGLLHAAFSSIEVLGTVIVGVAGLPIRILDRSGHLAALQGLRTPGGSAQPATVDAWRELANGLEAAEGKAGPAGWRKWLSDYRNMIAHRGRLLSLQLVNPTRSELIHADGLKRTVVDVELRLRRNPGRAEIRALELDLHGATLDEPAEVTASRLASTVRAFIESASQELEAFWARRRSGMVKIDQPCEQWPNTQTPDAIQFAGFDPREPLRGPLVLATSDRDFGRLGAAGMVIHK